MVASYIHQHGGAMAAAADLKPNNDSLVYLTKDSWETIGNHGDWQTSPRLLRKSMLENRLQQTRNPAVEPLELAPGQPCEAGKWDSSNWCDYESSATPAFE